MTFEWAATESASLSCWKLMCLLLISHKYEYHCMKVKWNFEAGFETGLEIEVLLYYYETILGNGWHLTSVLAW